MRHSSTTNSLYPPACETETILSFFVKVFSECLHGGRPPGKSPWLLSYSSTYSA